ncbi:Hypothetical predicted protein [Lecanosticta acicola]|uniref:Uncharacterized protein n=1 Tax=Lecanosticta acicola TaxID=111012 RepID=A0AAI8Z2W3_9PEZI|nr:Hypothetical predicted protein [Lecanosticta acicola]
MSQNPNYRNKDRFEKTANGNNDARNPRSNGPYNNNNDPPPNPPDRQPPKNINPPLAMREEEQRRRQAWGQQQPQKNQQQEWKPSPKPGGPSMNSYYDEYTPSPIPTTSGNPQASWRTLSDPVGSTDALRDYQRMLLREQQRRNKEFGKGW